MDLLDRYDELTSNLVTSTVGPIPMVGVAVNAGLPYLLGRVLGAPKLGAMVSLGLLARLLLQGQQAEQSPPYSPYPTDAPGGPLTITVPDYPRGAPDLVIRYPAQ